MSGKPKIILASVVAIFFGYLVMIFVVGSLISDCDSFSDVNCLEETYGEVYENEDATAQEKSPADSSSGRNKYPFVAVITCGIPSAQKVGWQTCLGKLETQIDGRSGYHETYSLAGRPWDKGSSIEFSLTDSFEIKAMNNGENLALEVEILDLNGRSVFQKQAGYMGWISVGN